MSTSMGTTTHQAAFSGTCAECGRRYPPRTIIRATPDGQWAHWDCPPGADPLPGPRAGEVTCPVGFLIHPAGKCDR